MGWAEARRLADVAFSEFSLQAIYAFRLGNPPPEGDGRRLALRARRRVTQSKVVIGALLAFLSLGAGSLLRLPATERLRFVSATLSTGLFDTAVLTGLLALDVALLWWTGVQALPTLLSSSVLEVLTPLPIDRTTLRRVAGLLYLKLFDGPVAVVLVSTPLAVGWGLGIAAGLVALLAAVCAVTFALALSLVTGRFFVRRVQGARGGGGSTLVRWAFLVLWLVPAFAVLGFVTLAPAFLAELAQLGSAGPSPIVDAVTVAFPFSEGLMTAAAAFGVGAVGSTALTLAVAADAAYAALAGWAGVWLFRSVAAVGSVPAAEPRSAQTSYRRFRSLAPPFAVLVKDLRIASRSPGYAFLILLPLLDAVALGLVSVVGAPASPAAAGLAFGAVSAAALLATFFGPAFFALEVLAQSYTRSLPLAPRSLVLGKTTLVVAIYVTASAIVLGITSVRVPASGVFAAFVLAELPAVAAGAFVELGLVFRWARARGLPVTNLYAGTLNVLLVSVPGLVVVAAPLILYGTVGVTGMALVAVAELGVGGAFALGRYRS